MFEYWPTNLLKLFEQAGIGRKIPPPLHPVCRKEASGDIGPKIIFPKKNIVYNLRTTGSDFKTIQLVAVGDGNVTRFSWFVDNQPVGKSMSQDSLLWKAEQGIHTIRVLDEFGRSSDISIEVKWLD